MRNALPTYFYISLWLTVAQPMSLPTAIPTDELRRYLSQIRKSTLAVQSYFELFLIRASSFTEHFTL